MPRTLSEPRSQDERSLAWRIAAVAFMVLRVPLFLVLYWLRLPVVLLCNFISVPTLFAFLFTLMAYRDKTHMLVAFGVVSLLSFVIAWAYDYVLALLSPQDTIKIL